MGGSVREVGHERDGWEDSIHGAQLSLRRARDVGYSYGAPVLPAVTAQRVGSHSDGLS